MLLDHSLVYQLFRCQKFPSNTNFQRHESSCFPAAFYQQIDKSIINRELHKLLILKHLHLVGQDSKVWLPIQPVSCSLIIVAHVTCFRTKYIKIACLPKSYKRESVFCYQREITISTALGMNRWMKCARPDRRIQFTIQQGIINLIRKNEMFCCFFKIACVNCVRVELFLLFFSSFFISINYQNGKCFCFRWCVCTQISK